MAGAQQSGAGALQGGAETHGRDWYLEETETQETGRAYMAPKDEAGSVQTDS